MEMVEAKRKKKTSVVLNQDLWREFKASTAADGAGVSETLEKLISAYMHNRAIRN